MVVCVCLHVNVTVVTVLCTSDSLLQSCEGYDGLPIRARSEHAALSASTGSELHSWKSSRNVASFDVIVCLGFLGTLVLRIITS